MFDLGFGFCMSKSSPVTPSNTWKPPKSPYNLIQEQLYEDPWKILVACIFCNLTRRNTAEPLIWEYFEKYPCLELAYHSLKLKKSAPTTLNAANEVAVDAFLKIKTSDLKTALISVKGIGDETADDIILYAARRPVFVIDKFTKRILSRYGLTPTRNSYRSWQEFLHRNIEEDTLKFQRFHAFLVMLAQQSCKTKPQCSTCVLKERCFTGCKVLL